MKQLLLTLTMGLLLGSAAMAQAQSFEVRYEYGASGNRLKRKMVPVTIKSAQVATEEDEQPIEEVWGERKVTIFPNPTQGDLKVSVTGGEPEADYSYVLYDVTGKQILTGQINQLGQHPVAMQHLKSGIYIFIIQCNDERLTYKIIKE